MLTSMPRPSDMIRSARPGAKPSKALMDRMLAVDEDRGEWT
jgi:hypothetical protein